MKNKYLRVFIHILIILISLYAWNFDRPIFSGEYNFIRTALTAYLYAYIPYLFLGWTKKTRLIAPYVCVIWITLFLFMKMGF